MEGELATPPSGGRREAPDDEGLARRARELLDRPDVAGAVARLRDDDERTLRDQMELTRIPAPPFGEEARGRRMAELFDEAGLTGVETDDEGNVLAWLEGRSEAPPFVLAAHLDTVFPAGTDLTVRRDGDRLEGPGISDDGRGLAALLAMARAMVAAEVVVECPVLFVATVGEEGAGDLRGVRNLFREGSPARHARAFVSLDGAGVRRVVSMGLGSRRYRIHALGRGGHSWVDFGTPNPIHALGRLVAGATSLPLPRDPMTSLTVARWSGGTSVNAIPRDAWIELEIRSEALDAVEALDREVRRLAEEAVAGVNASAADGAPVDLRMEPIGDRPAGATPPESKLVRAASAATRAVGAEPELALSSTDANVPMALGIPAVTLGAGGTAGSAHTPDEWYRNNEGPDGIVRALLTLLLIDGM